MLSNLSVTRALVLLLTTTAAAQPALTVYNQSFAVVRERLRLDLKPGVNRVTHTGVTAFVEPESVTLRDPTGKVPLRILEQNYRADPISMEALLAAYEGRVIDFEIRKGEDTVTVPARIVRAGSMTAPQQPGPNLYFPRPGELPVSQPVVEIGGKLRFGLPGTPLFPALPDGAMLAPSLEWSITSPAAVKLEAELAYITGAMNWEADYSMIQRADGLLDVTGWVTIDNRTGRRFENVRVKLMAGDVNKVLRPEWALRAGLGGGVVGGFAGALPPAVTEKSFDEYHLYTLAAPTTLAGREKKQVEFVRSGGVKAAVVYVYDGMKLDLNRVRGMPPEALRMDPSFGGQSTNKVWVMREFANSEANQLGVPLAKGRVRFYRRDSDGQIEFTGEDTIDHTPAGETVRVFTGAAFDLVGERRRTANRVDHQRSTVEESFEIKVRNRKKEPAEVRVVEHLYRWNTWEITVSSGPYVKKDSDTVEFTLQLQPGEEKEVNYAVRYTW